MVVLGGLEIVIGGYLYHRHRKGKKERQRLEAEALQSQVDISNNDVKPPLYPQKQEWIPLPPQHKYIFDISPQHYPQPQNAKPIDPAQRHPPVIQPLRRQNSFSSLSSMPVVDGPAPHDVDPQLSLPPRPKGSVVGRRPLPSHSPLNRPYGNPGFSVSTPSFAAAPASPMRSATQPGVGLVPNGNPGNGHLYAPQSPYIHMSRPQRQTSEDSEDDPPPPYQP